MGQNRWVRHVSAVIFKTEDGFEIQCYVHLFNSCTQNWFSIASIIEHVLSMVKNQNPKIINCVLEKWQCWLQSQQSTSPSLTWYWYENWHLCTTVCDRKISPMKGHIRRFVNEKNDVLSAEDMKRALESHGGVKGCKFIVDEVDLPSKAILKKQQNQ